MRLFANNGFNRLATSSAIAASVSSGPAVISVRLTSPFPGTTFIRPSAIDVQAEASVTSGALTKVDFYAGTTVIGTATALPYAVSWPTPADGDYLVTAVATDGLGASNVSTASYVGISNFGTGVGYLGTPVAAPSSTGIYGPGQPVTLSAAAGATIRFTTDGTEPTATSSVYTSAITLTHDMLIQAQAFQAGWEPSGVVFANYHIDLAPPSIYSILSPLPNGNGWNATNPVTVSFVCSDPAGVQACPTPIAVAQEGVTR